MTKRWCLIIRGIEANEHELQLAQNRVRDVFGLPAAGTITILDYIYEEQTKLVRQQPQGARTAGSRQGTRVGNRPDHLDRATRGTS